jgi:hypothetical protein
MFADAVDPVRICREGVWGEGARYEHFWHSIIGVWRSPARNYLWRRHSLKNYYSINSEGEKEQSTLF